jgi:alkyl sulfatase BDS1-like metallo-beta-lactamase superfamily hydrolase
MPADFDDRTDFENSDRGFIAKLDPMVIKNADGRVVWDMNWGFLEADCPDTVNPSLWRQAQLTSRHGLYEVADGIYQVRGFDMSNMTLVEGDQGVIVIDPLISQEVAGAAIALYREHRGDRAVTAIIYTHAHIDHFGGVLGVVDADTAVPIWAPEHFLEHGVSENVYAGTAMLWRGYYYSAVAVPKSPAGNLGIGLGAGGSTGTLGLIAPTHDITHTGQEEVIEPTFTNSAGMAPALTTTQLFDSIAIRVDGPKAWSESLSINWILTDEKQRYRMELRNGALVHYPARAKWDADATITLTRPQLLHLLTEGTSDGVNIDGDGNVMGKLAALLDAADPEFAVVTP